MNSFLKQLRRDDLWWAAMPIVLAGYFLWKAIAQNRWTLLGWPHPELVATAAGVAFSVALLAGTNAARWFGAAWLAMLGTVVILDGIKLNWDWGATVGMGLFIILVIYFCSHFLVGERGT